MQCWICLWTKRWQVFRWGPSNCLQLLQENWLWRSRNYHNSKTYSGKIFDWSWSSFNQGTRKDWRSSSVRFQQHLKFIAGCSLVRFVCFGVCLFWNFNPPKAWHFKTNKRKADESNFSLFWKSKNAIKCRIAEPSLLTCSWHQKTKPRIHQFTNLKCWIKARESF